MPMLAYFFFSSEKRNKNMIVAFYITHCTNFDKQVLQVFAYDFFYKCMASEKICSFLIILFVVKNLVLIMNAWFFFP